MRIAIFTDGFYPELGGIQDSVRLLAKTLGARGHQVLCVVPRASKSDYELSHVPEKELDLGPNVCIARVPSILVKGSNLQSRFILPTFTRWKLLRSLKPEVIHTQTFFGLGFEAIRAARKLKIPLVGTNHSAVTEFMVYAPVAPKLLGRLTMHAVIWYYNRCDFVTGPSHSVLNEMVQNGLTAQHEVVSNPIDIDIFRSRSREERQALKKKAEFSNATVIYAGRFGIEKHIDVLLRALPIVRARIPDAMLVLAGHGRDEPRLRTLASKLGILESVRFLGTVSQKTLAEKYAGSDAFAIASTSETQSMVLLQAFACGLPAVGADWRSLQEYIPQSVGYRARSLDHEDFARKILMLLTDKRTRERMGEEATKFAAQFAPDAVASAWEGIYQRLISRS